MDRVKAVTKLVIGVAYTDQIHGPTIKTDDLNTDMIY